MVDREGPRKVKKCFSRFSMGGKAISLLICLKGSCMGIFVSVSVSVLKAGSPLAVREWKRVKEMMKALKNEIFGLALISKIWPFEKELELSTSDAVHFLTYRCMKIVWVNHPEGEGVIFTEQSFLWMTSNLIFKFWKGWPDNIYHHSYWRRANLISKLLSEYFASQTYQKIWVPNIGASRKFPF